jgi:hypothetical protein
MPDWSAASEYCHEQMEMSQASTGSKLEQKEIEKSKIRAIGRSGSKTLFHVARCRQQATERQVLACATYWSNWFR